MSARTPQLSTAANITQLNYIMAQHTGAEAVASALRTGQPIPAAEADRLLGQLGCDPPEAELVRVVRVFHPFIRSCDWPSYVMREELPRHGLRERERESLEALHDSATPSGPVEGDPAVEHFSREDEHHEEEQPEPTPVQRLEALTGTDRDAVAAMASVFGSTTEAFLTLPSRPAEQLPVRVRTGPTAAERTAEFSHQDARFFHAVLRAIGARGRGTPEVIRLCGRELSVLFPDEVAEGVGTYAFRQARLLIGDRLSANPNDVETLSWHAALALRAGDELDGRETAGRLWGATVECDPTTLARVVQFSLCHDWDYSEPSFNGTDRDAGLLGGLEGDWYDRHEPLAHALIRRAFAQGHWHADLVQTVRELCCGWEGHDLGADVMPASGWVWAAHEEGPAGNNYYRAWERALEAARLRGESGVAVLAVSRLVVGGMLRRCAANYAEWLGQLQESATTPGTRRAAARVVAALRNVEALPAHVERLPTPVRALLESLAIEFADELAGIPADDLGEVRDLAEGLLDVDRQAVRAVEYLGERVWDRLAAHTRELVLQTIGVYRSFWESRGDRRDFGPVFVQLANAVVHEVEEQFSLALELEGRRYFEYAERHKSPGALSYILRLLVHGSNPAARRDAHVLRRKGIRLDALVAFAPDLIGLGVIRNDGAHAGARTDRERAAIVFGDWFEKGQLRRLFETLFPR